MNTTSVWRRRLLQIKSETSLFSSFRFDGGIFFKERLSIYQLFTIVCLIYLCSLSSLFRANFNYCDDLSRVVEGVAGWENFSRFTSNFLAKILHTSTLLSDISPLTQILAVIFLSLAGCTLLKVLTRKEKFSFCTAFALIPLGLCPYFLECLSYKYDSPYMALSVLMAVVPFIYIGEWFKYCVITVVSCLIICTTYQVSIAVWMISLFFVTFIRWVENNYQFNIAIKILIYSGLSFFLGLIIFKSFIMIPVQGYVDNSISFSLALIPHIFRNILTYFKFIYADFNSIWLVLIFLITFFCFCSLYKKLNTNTVFKFLVISILFLLTLASSYGLYPLLNKAFFAPRAMYGIGAFISICCIFICADKKNYLGKLVVFFLSWCFVVFSSIYGNSLNAQKSYTSFRTFLVFNDLNYAQAKTNQEIKQIRFLGSIGYAPIIKKSVSQNRMLDRLVPTTLGDGWMWAYYGFLHHYGLNVEYNPVMSRKSMPLIVKTKFNTIYGSNGQYLIELH